jgi:hypothetical protein
MKLYNIDDRIEVPLSGEEATMAMHYILNNVVEINMVHAQDPAGDLYLTREEYVALTELLGIE